jgi:hypothetical protein
VGKKEVGGIRWMPKPREGNEEKEDDRIVDQIWLLWRRKDGKLGEKRTLLTDGRGSSGA